MLQVLMSRTNGGKGPMKDAFIMSTLPPEEDPLLAGLQGVDSVIEHFIKNAQGRSDTYFLQHKILLSFTCSHNITCPISYIVGVCG